MAKTDMSNLTEITYLDGTTNIVAVTMFDRVAAEKYAVSHGGRAGNDSPILQNGYATYYALRRDKQIAGIDFNDWMASVVTLGTPEQGDADEEEDETSEDGDSQGKSLDSPSGQTGASEESLVSSAPASA